MRALLLATAVATAASDARSVAAVRRQRDAYGLAVTTAGGEPRHESDGDDRVA